MDGWTGVWMEAPIESNYYRRSRAIAGRATRNNRRTQRILRLFLDVRAILRSDYFFYRDVLVPRLIPIEGRSPRECRRQKEVATCLLLPRISKRNEEDRTTRPRRPSRACAPILHARTFDTRVFRQGILIHGVSRYSACRFFLYARCSAIAQP